MTHAQLAVALQRHQEGRLADAERLYREILARDPGLADAWHLLGMLAHQSGDHDRALRLIERAISLDGQFPDYHNNLASVHYARGDYPAAEACCRRALELQPAFAPAHNNLGNALVAQNRAAEALSSYQEAIRLNPQYVKAWTNAAHAWRSLGRLDEAIRCHGQAMQLCPGRCEAHKNLAVVFRQAQQYAQAEEHLRLAIGIETRDAHAHNDLGELLWRRGAAQEAVACFRIAIEIMPSLAVAHFNLGNALREAELPDEAEQSYRAALRADPGLVAALTNLAITLSDQGRIRESLDLFQRACTCAPDDAMVHSHWLVCRQYQPGATWETLGADHAEWNRRHAARWTAAGDAGRRPGATDRPLKIGLVSRDFRYHPIGFFLVAALESLDQQRFHVTCYADQRSTDRRTERIRAACTTWRDVCGRSDDELAQLVRADRMDILIDLAGHTAHHRLLMFARRPAPRQATWMGYVGTTGLAAMDYLISDRFHAPEGVEAFCAERIIRLPDDYICYAPPEEAPPVKGLPALSSGYVTFGCFNNPAKISDQTLQLWAAVLRRVPRGRLLLKYDGLDGRGAAAHLVERWVAQGIDPHRVDLEGQAPHRELLERYNAVDLALDTQPYSGGLTTCEALWMGVPVISLPGQTFAGRHAFSHLSNAGVTEAIAKTNQEYVERAVELASDTQRLAELRAGLRLRVSRSPLCDGQRFARGWEQALLAMWQQQCGPKQLPWNRPNAGCARKP